MRPQLHPPFGSGPSSELELDDLGWNDFGGTLDDGIGLAAASNRSDQMEDNASGIARSEPPVSVEPIVTARQIARRHAFTLKLNAERQLQLHLASILENRSCQQLLMQAIDKFIL